jgi:Flp pilus assembly protein TadG
MLNQCVRKNRRGQATLLVTFSLVPMVGLLGLATDLGYMHYVKQSAQAAADSAVLAAVSRFHSDVSGSSYTCNQAGVICGSSYSCPPTLTTAANAIQTACLYAKQNGFTASGNQNVLVDSNTGSTPPATVSGVTSAAFWISVRVSQRVPQLFSIVTGNTTGLVSARATAAVVPAKDCIYAMDPSSAGAYYQNGNTTVTSACGIYVNSNNAQAMYNSGGSSILSASEYDIVGNYSWNGTLSPSPNTGAPTMPDPLKNLAAPSPCSATGGCDSAGCAKNSKVLVINTDTTLSPGTYCGGIFVKNATVTFSPGTYTLVGGGIGTQDTNSIIRGSGVTLYNTYDTNHPYSGFDFNANSDVQLSAPTSGTYTAILAMQDRNVVQDPYNPPAESFQGGANAKFEGVLYFPKSILEFAGNPTMSSAHYTIMVAWRISVQGDSKMNNDYSVLSGGSPIQSVGLIE